MKKLFYLSLILCCAKSIICMDGTAEKVDSSPAQYFAVQGDFLHAAREGDVASIDILLAEERGRSYNRLIRAKTIREGRSVLHVAALRYLVHSNPYCFDVFRSCFEDFKSQINVRDIRDNGKRNVEELITKKMEPAQNPTPGMKVRAELLIGVLNGKISRQDQVTHILDTPTADEVFLNDARKGDLQAIMNFLAKQPNAEEYLNTTKDRRKHRPALHCAAMGYLFSHDEATRLKCLNTFLYLLVGGADPRVTEDTHQKALQAFIRAKTAKHETVIEGLEQKANVLIAVMLTSDARRDGSRDSNNLPKGMPS